MSRIKRIKIHGLKKLIDFEMSFNESMNIIVGDNEVGKSTILDAINIVLRQKYKNYDKYIIKELLNSETIRDFLEHPSIDNLPYIKIDLELALDNSPKSGLFFGMNHSFEKDKRLYGVEFKCQLADEFITDKDVLSIIGDGRIPYEYYQMTWKTFQGDSYQIMNRPINYLAIDNDESDAATSYNYYCKALFANSHDNLEQSKIKDQFRHRVQETFSELEIKQLGDHRSFGVSDKKIIFDNVITILEDNIPIENKGRGRENIIKTQIAIEKNELLDVLSVEEPETHLSFPNLKKMLKSIESLSQKQVIITTHESMIASGLGLQNILWIRDKNAVSLKDLPSDDAKFFVKAPTNNMLQFILSNKVILVEGPTEFMLVPRIFEKICGSTADDAGITILSCNGIAYKRFLSIAEKTSKKIAIITDNDGKQANLEMMRKYSQNNDIHIFMDEKLDNWTWEVCFYNQNKEKLDQLIDINENADYQFNGKKYGKVLGKMLNNKAEIAYKMLVAEDFDFNVPKYLKEACLWINGQF